MELDLFKQGEASVVKELLKSVFGKSEHTLAALLLGLLDKFAMPSTHPTAVKMIAMCDEVFRELQVGAFN